MIFKREHVPMILDGRKTQTRRTGKKRWNVGAVHQCKTSYTSKPFAMVRILRVWQERLGGINWRDAIAEGYPSQIEYLEAFYRIYKIPWWDTQPLNEPVWCVEFELVETPA